MAFWCEDAEAVRRFARVHRHRGRRVAVVSAFAPPHAGHVALVREARRLPGVVVVLQVHGESASPAQWQEFATEELVDALFMVPDRDGRVGVFPVRSFGGDMQQWEAATWGRDFLEPGFDVEALSLRTTTVLADAVLAQATDIFYGERDFEVLALVAQGAHDMQLGAQLHAVPIVRTRSGIPVGSDAHPEVQDAAEILAAALLAGVHQAEAGARVVVQTVREVLESAGADVDYIMVRSRVWDTPPEMGDARVAAAIRVGDMRVHDNMGLPLGIGLRNLS